ncbi:MAG TPA: methyltransferase domain-containing protein [Ktedonobacterales bacterium]|jgi:ubiquinone/menaquinone biosynthesis C-methylase UbiE
MPIEEQNAVSEQETSAAPSANENTALPDDASMDVSQYPTIDNDWDKLAAEYPDIYERFANAPNDGALDQAMREIVSFKDKLVLDMGAGTGQYAFGFANEAFRILGMEADPDLLDFDRQVIDEKGYTNIIPFHGLANDLPINDDMIDIALAVTVAPWDQDPLMRLGLRKRMVEETLRILKPGGTFIVVTVPEGAYGGELAPIIFEDINMLPNNSDWDAQLIEDFGFEHKKVESVSDYGSVENAVATYGFIFGHNAIRHLLEHQQQTITWRYRMLWTHKPEAAPDDEQGEPAQEHTEPAQEQAAPAKEQAEPTSTQAKQVEPAQEQAQPIEKQAKSANKPSKPAKDKTKPAKPETAP